MSEKPRKRLVVTSNAGRKRTANVEKLPPRLVSKSLYVLTTGKKIGMYSLASCLAIAVTWLLTFGKSWLDRVQNQGILLFLGVITLAVIWAGLRLFARAKEIEPVRPLTKRNAHLLQAEEALLRASDLPPSHQQAELLRAAKPGQETPAEELLRATTSSKSEMPSVTSMRGETNDE